MFVGSIVSYLTGQRAHGDVFHLSLELTALTFHVFCDSDISRAANHQCRITGVRSVVRDLVLREVEQ